MSKEYPEDPEKFPNKSTITKERITAKLKSIRTGFKKAADRCWAKKWRWKSSFYVLRFV